MVKVSMNSTYLLSVWSLKLMLMVILKFIRVLKLYPFLTEVYHRESLEVNEARDTIVSLSMP